MKPKKERNKRVDAVSRFHPSAPIDESTNVTMKPILGIEMTRPNRKVTFAVAGLMACICRPAPSFAFDPDWQMAVHPRGPWSETSVLAINPRPQPPRPPFHAAGPAAALPTGQVIRQCVETDMQAIGAPGAAVTVILDGQVIFSGGFGIKRRGYDDPVNANTRFRIGSITKMLTAAAVMHQLDVGLVDLEDPVIQWIPELDLNGPWSSDAITVRHLLTHSSGFPDHVEHPYSPTGDQALGQWAGTLDDVVLLSPPGAFWNYSNPGYCLAGLVAERASGMHYRELMERTVFDRAGMDATTFSPAEAMASANYSYGHDVQGVFAPDAYESWMASPSGLAFSTAPDLARWALLLMDGGGIVLSISSAEAVQERQIYLDHIPGLHYGFGVFAEQYKGLDVRQHGGNIPGWGAFLLWIPEERFAVAVLANTTPPVDYSTDPATWTRYAGTYHLLSDKGVHYDAVIRKKIDRFFMTVIDPDDRSVVFTTDLVQEYLDTFSVDRGFDPLEPDLSIQPAVTFISRDTSGHRTMWLRNRGIVGERVMRPIRADRRVAPD
jgi:CubicO group peptidase (beta-lactamase class C family)